MDWGGVEDSNLLNKSIPSEDGLNSLKQGMTSMLQRESCENIRIGKRLAILIKYSKNHIMLDIV